jgi:hypothetical protein
MPGSKAILMNYIRSTAMALTILLPALPAAWAAETEERTPHRVPRVNSAIEVDGTLDETVWKEALELSLDYEVRPGENIPPPVETVVLFAYDKDHLYVAYECHDPDPSRICARVCDRDNLWDDDWVALVLDTFNDQRRNFLLVVNPLGVQADNIEVTGGEGAEWDAIWDSAGRITGDGYTVEMAVPFSSLRFQRSEEDQVWGVDAIRSYPRGVRHHIGLFPRDRNNNCYLCQAEKLIGFAGATPGKNLEITPTFSMTHNQARAHADTSFSATESKYEVGLTGSWGFTPNLVLGATINPDFSQVEADAAQLDINTQFAIYYDEKRPFFLEATDFFDSRLNVVYTRTLADPRWGVKVTGKEGPSAIGAFVVRDERTNLLLPGVEDDKTTDLGIKTTGSVGRYRHDIGSSSMLGVFVTDREGKNYYNRLIGLDTEIRFTDTELFRGQVIATRTSYPDSIPAWFDQPAGEFDGFGYDLFYIHETSGLDWYAVYRNVDRNYRSDLGWRPMVGFRYSEAGCGYTWYRPSDHWYHQMNFGMGYEYEDQHTGELVHKGASAWYNYDGRCQSEINLYGFYGKIRYRGETFDGRWVDFDAGFWPTGSLFLWIEGDFGRTIDYDNVRQGRQMTLSPYAEYKWGRHLEIELSHTYRKFNVDQGHLFTANISRVRAIYQFNVRCFLRAIVQYKDYWKDPGLYLYYIDKEQQHLTSQVLFSYKVNPQTVLFIGYSDYHEGDDDVSLTQMDRTVFAKIGYAWVP